MDDKLREMARQALTDAGYDEGQAMGLLQHRDDSRHRLREYHDALDWAVAHRPADSLPNGSIVATQTLVYIKTHRGPGWPAEWQCTSGGTVWDNVIDDQLADGAKVLRVGTGEG